MKGQRTTGTVYMSLDVPPQKIRMNKPKNGCFSIGTMSPDELIIKLLPIVCYCTVLLVLMIMSWYILRLLCAKQVKTELQPLHYLESFQKLHEDGNLSKEEYRLVRRLISLQLTRKPDEPKPDYSLLTKNSPPKPADCPSGNIPKK